MEHQSIHSYMYCKFSVSHTSPESTRAYSQYVDQVKNMFITARRNARIAHIAIAMLALQSLY